MKVKPPIWTFDQEDQIKVLQSTRHEQHSVAAAEPAARGDGNPFADEENQIRGPKSQRGSDKKPGHF
jgi:hypothetical protein